MAETFVSKDQFEEFTKRMEQGFDHVNQRFDDMRDDMRDDLRQIHNDLRQMRNWLIALYGIVVFGFIGTLVITIFKEQLFK